MLCAGWGPGGAVPRDWGDSWLRSLMGCGLQEVSGALQAAPSLQKPF